MSTKVTPQDGGVSIVAPTKLAELEPQIATLFERYDANHDGQFEKAEVVVLLRDLLETKHKISLLRKQVCVLFLLLILSLAGSFGASILANHATKEFTHRPAHNHEDHLIMTDVSGRPVETAAVSFQGPSLFDLRDMLYDDLTKMHKIEFTLNGTRHFLRVAGVSQNEQTEDIKIHAFMVGTSLSILQDHIEFAELNRPVRAFTTAERLASLGRRLPAVSVSVSVEESSSSKTTYDSMMLCLKSPTSGSCKKTKKFLLMIKTSGACVAAPVPSTFDRHLGSLGSQYLRDRALLNAATPRDVQSLIRNVGGLYQPSQPIVCADNATVLNRRQRASLLEHLEVQWTGRHDGAHNSTNELDSDDDYRIGMTQEELTVLVGGEHAMHRLRQAFNGSFDTIKLRRVQAKNSKHSKNSKNASSLPSSVVPFHSDHAYRVMQIPLNDRYEGGNLVFATLDGFQVPIRPAGSFTLHTQGVVHAVTQLTQGVRKSLFLVNTQKNLVPLNVPVDLAPLLQSAVTAQFAQLRASLNLLSKSTDTELHDIVSTYRSTVESAKSGNLTSLMRGVCSGSGVPQEPPMCIAWRTHMLRPLLYAQTCATSALDAEALDLVAALRRQQKFMQKIQASKRDCDVDKMVRGYHHFLLRLRTMHTTGLEYEVVDVPSLMVDGVWHAHLQMPERYTSDVVGIVGRMIDHNDELDEV